MENFDYRSILVSIIIITYQEERKIQAVTVMRVRMWATSPWGGHSSWYALDIRGLFSQYDIEKKESYKSPWLSNLKEYPSIYFCTCIAWGTWLPLPTHGTSLNNEDWYWSDVLWLTRWGNKWNVKLLVKRMILTLEDCGSGGTGGSCESWICQKLLHRITSSVRKDNTLYTHCPVRVCRCRPI